VPVDRQHAQPKKRRSRRKAEGTPSVIASEASEPSESSAKPASKPRRKKKQTDAPIARLAAEPIAAAAEPVAEPGVVVWQPTMPTIPAAPSVPWRRPTFAPSVQTVQSTPSLVIDDADPELAEREQDERAAAADQRVVSFLPPILLDRDDRSARQGGLTLAVIILLIAATLTLSYLMRRPDVSGDGVTMADVPATLA
jgi:hypothetical protein